MGWDHPLLTYFVIVKDKTREIHYEEEAIVFWEGTSPREIYEIEDLEKKVRKYADLTPQLKATLYGDKDEGR